MTSVLKKSLPHNIGVEKVVVNMACAFGHTQQTQTADIRASKEQQISFQYFRIQLYLLTFAQTGPGDGAIAYFQPAEIRD